MGPKKFSSEGLHHGKAKRTYRNRDGQTWDPDGDGVPPQQFGGHDSGSGSMPKGGKASSKTKGNQHSSK